jgi:hypothetical protein
MKHTLTPSPINRRTFLSRTSLAVTGLCAAPRCLPASTTPANSRIQMGFIGLGGQGAGHLLGGAWTYVPGGYVARDDVQVRAVCDVREERREHARQRCNQMYAQRSGQADYRDVLAYRDFREVLARADIDAVLIAVPYHWAAPMSAMALRAGKDVYCEKPVAITVQEGANLVATSRRYSRIYQAGTQQRSEYGGKFRLACELVRSGRLGQLREVYAYRQPGAFYPTPWTLTRSTPVPAGFDWDLWLGPLPWRPFHGEAGHALPGHFVGDVNWSPHHYDFIQWVINPDPRAPIEVVPETHPTQPGEIVVHYRYSNGVVVHSTPYPNESVGDDGGACFVGSEGRLAVDRANIRAEPASILNTPLRPDDQRLDRINSHSGNFLDCIRTRRDTICHPSTAVYSMNAILIGGIAMVLRRALRWNPAANLFVDDPEANRLLSYPVRPPWQL